MRSGDVDQLIEGMDREGFAGLMEQAAPAAGAEAIDEYWKGFATIERRRAGLALYRSGDFEKLARYEGCLAQLEVPTLLLWGEKDDYAPVASAHRFKREIPHAELVILDGAQHFIMEDQPEAVAFELRRFLATL
jgi:pimeloyl-ACP methyl ester carboxylesterase